jgi:hypothetical protein
MQSYGFVLNWFHEEPCRRRPSFPTWSSIAWDGKAEHADQDQLMVPDHVDIRVLSSRVSESLGEYVRSGRVLQDSGSLNAPPKLELRQVTTVPLTLTTVEDGTVCVILQLSIDIDVFILMFIDEAPKLGLNFHRSHNLLREAVTANDDFGTRIQEWYLRKSWLHHSRRGKHRGRSQ